MASNASDFTGGGAKLWVSGATYAQGKFAVSGSDFTLYIRKVTGAGATDPASDPGNWQPFGGRAIKSIQRDVISLTLNQGTKSITITAVNPLKSIIVNLGSSDSSGNGSGQCQVALTGPTTILAINGGGSASVGWQVTEYY